jgi:subtilase family serine protease
MTQSGTTVIYSGDSNSLKYWENGLENGFVFGTVSGATPSGNVVLIQSASTDFVSSELIYIGLELENNFVIPTPTPTATPTETSVTPTPTPTVTPT